MKYNINKIRRKLYISQTQGNRYQNKLPDIILSKIAEKTCKTHQSFRLEDNELEPNPNTEYDITIGWDGCEATFHIKKEVLKPNYDNTEKEQYYIGFKQIGSKTFPCDLANPTFDIESFCKEVCLYLESIM